MPLLMPSFSLQDLQEKLLIAQKKYNELFNQTDRSLPTIQTISNLAVAYHNLGDQQFSAEEYETAIATFQKALALPKNDNTDTVINNLTIAYNGLAQQLKSNGKFTEAAALFERVYIDEAKIPTPDGLNSGYNRITCSHS